MNIIKKTLLVSLLSMPCVASENSIKTSEIESRIMSLTITPFAYNVYKSYKDLGYFKEYLPAQIVYKSFSETSCEISRSGVLTFTDFEGSSFGNFTDPDTKLPSAKDRVINSLEGDGDKVKEDVNKSLSIVKNKYCIDGIFSTVIDYRDGRRQYFDKGMMKEVGYFKSAIKSIDEWMMISNSHNIDFTIKHYPFTQRLHEYGSEKKLKAYEKNSDGKFNSPRELSVDTISPSNSFDMSNLSKIEKEVKRLAVKHGNDDIIMLTSRLVREYGYESYVLSDAPKKDSFLKSYDGLVISDDIYQLQLDSERVLKLFSNVDMVIVSSKKDLNLYVSTVLKAVKEDPIAMDMLIDKSDKVRRYRVSKKG